MELKNQEIPQAEFERVLHQIVDMELEKRRGGEPCGQHW